MRQRRLQTFTLPRRWPNTMVFWLVLTHRAGRLAGFFRWWGFVRVGEFSYGLYLLHVPVPGLTHAVVFGTALHLETLPRMAVTIGAAGLVLALAKLSWEYFEKPFIRRGQQFRYDSPA